MKFLTVAIALFAFTPALAMAASDFVKVDANGDGQATIEELTAAGMIWTKEQLAAADADGNGTLSITEYDARPSSQ